MTETCFDSFCIAWLPGAGLHTFLPPLCPEMVVLLSKLTVLGSSLSPDFAPCQSLIALGTAARLAQHRVQFIQQIGWHDDLSAQGGSPADGLRAMLWRNWQRQRLRMSGWRRGREELRLANVHRGSSERDLWGLEDVRGL